MAGPSVIGALRVVLGADTAALDKGLKDSQSKLASFGAGMATAGVAVATAVAAMGAAVAVAVKSTINQADNLGKMAQKIGIPVEELSKLKFAADLSDVSMESLGKSVGKLSKTMVEAAAKPTSEAANAFRALGVSVVDSGGKLKSSSDVISDIAGKFEGLKDGAGKTAVSMAIFGRSGAEMIPLLNSGKKGIEELKNEAEKLGIVMSTKTAKDAEAFNDNMKRLGSVWDGIILKLTAEMLPGLKGLSETLIQASKDSDLMKSAAGFLIGIFQGVVNVVLTTSLVFRRLAEEWAALREFLKTDVFSGKVIENWNKFTAVGEESRRQIDALRATIETAHLADAFGAIATKAAKAGEGLGDFNYRAMAGKNAIDQFEASTRKSIAAQNAEALTVGATAGAKEKLRVVLQGMQIAMANGVTVTDALRLRMDTLGFSAEQAALRLQGAQLVFAAKDPLLQYQIELANTEMAMRKVGATAEDLANNQELVAQKFGMSWSQIGSNIASTGGALSQLTGVFAKENKAMGIASKAFGIGQAIINTQVAITKAFATLPPPASYFAAALAAAQGAASIATISMQKFATGADFRIPGGIGGADNVPVSFMAQAGERVKVEPNRYGENSSGETRTVVVQGLNPREWFRGDIVRDFAEGLMGANRDGLQIKFT